MGPAIRMRTCVGVEVCPPTPLKIERQLTVVPRQHFAFNRAKHQLILTGSPQAYQMAAKKQEGVMRYSGLFRRPQILVLPS